MGGSILILFTLPFFGTIQYKRTKIWNFFFFFISFRCTVIGLSRWMPSWAPLYILWSNSFGLLF
jgi:hypothetical protein